MTELGSIEPQDDRFRLTMVRRLTAKIEAVWQAITEPAELSEWLGEVDFEPEEGSAIRIRFEGDDDDAVLGRVRSFAAPHVFEFTWSGNADDPDPSVVRFELETDGNHTVLTLIHSRQGRGSASGTAPGWHAHLDVLDGFLSGEPCKWEACYAVVRERYAPVLRAALGEADR